MNNVAIDGNTFNYFEPEENGHSSDGESVVDYSSRTARAIWPHNPSFWSMDVEKFGQWLPMKIEGFIYEAKAHLLYGPAGIGKSFVAKWAAHNVTLSGEKCLYFDREMGSRSVRQRFHQMGVDPTLGQKSIFYFDYPHIVPTDNGAVMITKDGSIPLTQLAESYMPSVVVFDSLYNFLGLAGLDESRNSDVERWVDRVLTPLKAMGIASLVLDHPGNKFGNGPRGAYSKVGTFDVTYMAERKASFSRQSIGELQVIINDNPLQTKDRDGQIWKTNRFRLGGRGNDTFLMERLAYSISEPTETQEGSQDPLEEEILASLPKEGIVGSNAWFEKAREAGVKVRKEAFTTHRKSLVKIGKVRETLEKKHAGKDVYRYDWPDSSHENHGPWDHGTEASGDHDGNHEKDSQQTGNRNHEHGSDTVDSPHGSHGSHLVADYENHGVNGVNGHGSHGRPPLRGDHGTMPDHDHETVDSGDHGVGTRGPTGGLWNDDVIASSEVRRIPPDDDDKDQGIESLRQEAISGDKEGPRRSLWGWDDEGVLGNPSGKSGSIPFDYYWDEDEGSPGDPPPKKTSREATPPEKDGPWDDLDENHRKVMRVLPPYEKAPGLDSWAIFQKLGERVVASLNPNLGHTLHNLENRGYVMKENREVIDMLARRSVIHYRRAPGM